MVLRLQRLLRYQPREHSDIVTVGAHAQRKPKPAAAGAGWLCDDASACGSLGGRTQCHQQVSKAPQGWLLASDI